MVASTENYLERAAGRIVEYLSVIAKTNNSMSWEGRMKSIARLIALSTISLLASTRPCVASLIAWDSFSAGDGFVASSYEGAFSDFWYAVEFQSQETGNVTLVEVPLSFGERRTNSVDVTLSIHEATGSALGPLLGSSTKSIGVPSTIDDTIGRIFSFDGWSSSLTGGNKYWMVLSAPPSTHQVNWHTAVPQPFATGGIEYRSTDGGTTWSGPSSPASALRVTLAGGNTIPEPTTLSILTLGLVGIGYSRRKN